MGGQGSPGRVCGAQCFAACKLFESLQQKGPFGSVEPAQAQRRPAVWALGLSGGAAWEGQGVSTRPRRRPSALGSQVSSEGSWGWYCCARGEGPAAGAFYFSSSSNWGDQLGCHFVARPPFRVAAGGRVMGEGRAAGGEGRGRADAQAAQGAKAGASPLFFAFGLGLCRDPPRTRAGCTRRVNLGKAPRGVHGVSNPFCLLSPSKVGLFGEIPRCGAWWLKDPGLPLAWGADVV